MPYIKCPKCLFQFDAEENLKDKVGDVSSFFQVISRKHSEPLFKKTDGTAEAVVAICPNCKEEVTFSEYKFFGFLTANRLRIIFVLIFLGVILFSIGVIINDLMK